MIDISHEVLPSPEQMEFIIEGMRNPMNSWDRSDSNLCTDFDGCERCPKYNPNSDKTCLLGSEPAFDNYILGFNDLELMMNLAKAGPVHAKYRRMIPVFVRITAPLYWWKEFDTYKVGTVSNSCSTMHKIQDKEFELGDFSTEHLAGFGLSDVTGIIIPRLNRYRWMFNNWDSIDDNSKNAYGVFDKKDAWWQMIQLLPSSYNQTRNVMLNYEVLSQMYLWRQSHKLDEWVEFCKWIETLPYAKEIIL